MKAGHEEKNVDGTSAAPWPQLDGVRPKTSPSLVDDGRSEDGAGRGGAKYNTTHMFFCAPNYWASSRVGLERPNVDPLFPYKELSNSSVL